MLILISAIIIFTLVAITIGLFCRKSNQPKETTVNAYTWLAIVSLVFSIYSAHDRIMLGPGSFWRDPFAALIGVIALVQIGRTGVKGKCIAMAGIAIGALFFLLNVYTILMLLSLDW